jgi:hypothetical protein
MRIINPQPPDSPGEAIVLQWLRELTDEWIVICQARFPKSFRKWDVQRVVDFIFVVPQHGILALEVKASPNVKYVDGSFRVGPDAQDPLKQVDDEFGKMYRWHQERFGRRAEWNIPMTAVLGLTAAIPTGPNTQAFIESPQTHKRYQVFYADSFRTPDKMRAAILGALAEASADWGTNALKFGPKEAADWAEKLMPSSEMHPTQQANVSRFVKARDEFTEQQQKVYFGLLKVAPKVFISGAWGTGKTFLAKHIAYSSARDGRRVCVIVKRKELMRDLQEEFQHELQRRGPFKGSIRVAIIDQLVGPKASTKVVKYDELILDQAEDFLDVEILDQLGSLLVNGWGPESRVKIFADYDNQGYQSLTTSKAVRGRLQADGFVGLDEAPLSHNLRNGRLIAQAVEKVARTSVYSDYLPEDGKVRTKTIEPGIVVPVASELLNHTPLRTWNVSQALVDVLRELKEEGFAPKDVVVLTALPRTSRTVGEPTASQSSPAFVAKGWDYKGFADGEVRNGRDGSPERPYESIDYQVPHDRTGLTDDWIPRDRFVYALTDSVTWCTVEEYAGCESPVIVLTDVHLAHELSRVRRITRGISRAGQLAVVINVNLIIKG